MRSSKVVHIVSCHAAGEVGDVIVGGVAPPPGDTIWEQRKFIAEDERLRNFVLNEPRGGVFRHVNLLVPPKHPDAQMGWIIMEPEDTPPMSGSNSICVATVLLDTGILPMTEPETILTLEAPGGLVTARAQCRDGKATSVSVQNIASFVDQTDVAVDVPGLGKLTVDTAFGGDSFVIVDSAKIDLDFTPDNARKIAEVGIAITNAANEQIGFTHPENADWKHISFCLFAGAIESTDDGMRAQSIVAIQPGKIDRSPTGTAISARMALLHHKGEMQVDDTLTGTSIIGSEFVGKILDTTQVGTVSGIIPEITGSAWVTGTHQHMLDPSDPWPEGYRLSDTWPVLR